MSERYIGLMSGTSLDGVDAVLADLQGGTPRLLAALTHPFPDALRTRLRALAEDPVAAAIDELGALDVTLGERFAEAVHALLAEAGIGPEAVRAIGSHGQTVRHRPGGTAPFTLQIGDPNVIAERTGITTVADLRRRDMAAGGQGAPLAPAFHAAVFRDPGEDRAVVNIGGMANVTVLPADPARAVSGFDTGPGNALLDGWIARHQGVARDHNGAWAAGGQAVPALLQGLLADAYFAAPPPKSTGREQFHMRWLDAALPALDSPPAPADVQATLAELTARSIAAAIDQHAPGTGRVLVCGGGAYNTDLMARLAQALGARTLQSTAEYGIAPEWVEGVAFAWLARQTLAGRPGNLPAVTGARSERVLGAVYWGGGTDEGE
ncbi:MAG TPA: anhydro-N-acetylmuramic acid kinase [Gammaproteobacteria bacterium]|nr:anhydro-N-acetylmuramic acid kinase [Gammaproteobacteria bacterium]